MAKKINLNDYLGHSMDCTCGKEHKTNLKIVDIDKDAVSRLPKHIEALGYKKPFLVADVNTWAAAGALAAVKLDVKVPNPECFCTRQTLFFLMLKILFL